MCDCCADDWWQEWDEPMLDGEWDPDGALPLVGPLREDGTF